MRRRQSHADAALLAVASICLSLLGVAFGLHPVHVPPGVFWGLIGITALIALAAVSVRLRRLVEKRGGHHRLTGSECRRLSEVIGALWNERQESRPKSTGLIANSSFKRRKWADESEAAYDKLKAWAIRVFEDAVACDAMSEASRPLVERPPAAQLHKVRDLFREAADTLEHA